MKEEMIVTFVFDALNVVGKTGPRYSFQEKLAPATRLIFAL